MKKLLFTTLIIVGMFAWGVIPAKSTIPQPFYLEKVCDGSIAPDICEITYAAEPFGILTGGTIKYFDHAYFGNPVGIYHEAATILITASDGSTAFGHVSWVWNMRGFDGHYTILPGTGSLAGLHVSGSVNLIDENSWLFSLTGNYFFAP